jgi:carbamoyl-phosphate synthase large subunit
MPRRDDIAKVLIIGSGPIVIGQACEFDYSGSQACKALKEANYDVVLVNSNPATIMTDPEMAATTYIEPLTLEVLTQIIARERPDALLPTLGGQTALNLAVFLAREGVLDQYGVESIGASPEAIARAEDRDLFKQAMKEIGIGVPRSGIAHNLKEGLRIAERMGFPLILRPAFTLGGTGGSVAYNLEEYQELLAKGLEWSPITEVLVEQSVIGWKEIEFEVMRDCADNVVIITSMENVDPMGVHTGDSIVVAPAQTLTAPEYQHLVDLCKKVIRKVGVTGGGVNIQFAVNPDDSRVVIIEVNPRLSRSSALASKATGFPIARVATQLAVGYTLDEVRNDVTGKTSAFAEPTVDYCVFKMPRFTFEKFPQADPTITTSMKSVGEAMSIGRSFKEALQKGLRSLETGRFGLGADGRDVHERSRVDRKLIRQNLTVPNAERMYWLRYAFLDGMRVEEIYELTKIDPWFLTSIQEIVHVEKILMDYRPKDLDLFSWKEGSGSDVPADLLRKAKEYGFSDRQIAFLLRSDEMAVRKLRQDRGIKPVYKPVDTCAGEFEAVRPYYYSTYELEDDNKVTTRHKYLILGGGPNRIGQGIEFDYCCCHASYALRDEGCESIMVNSNPETVSTDYDTSDKLYFEPLTLEDVLNIVEEETPEGVIVQFGGQTPLNIAVALEKAGVPILGTSPDSIDRAEDRDRFKSLLKKLDLQQPENGIATSFEGAKEVAQLIGYPVLVRPSYVLGGRAMDIVYDESSLQGFIKSAVEASPEHPILIDKFLEDAIEIDVDAVADGTDCVVCGVMEHIEEAGIHSGDSACVIPPYSLSDTIIDEIKSHTRKLACELSVVGLMNVQYAVKDETVYVLEVNPRASRTVPFVSKATGTQWAKVATKTMLGKTLRDQGIHRESEISHVAVKEAVFPFSRFSGSDALLGPEMKSTGEVMGIDSGFGLAFAKSQISAGCILPVKGTVFISVKNQDKRAIVFIAKKLADLGFSIVATQGTGKALKAGDIDVSSILKVHEGRPNVIDLIKNGEIHLIINTPTGKNPTEDQISIRSAAVRYTIPLITTISGAQAAVNGIEALKKRQFTVRSLQEYHQAMH